MSELKHSPTDSGRARSATQPGLGSLLSLPPYSALSNGDNAFHRFAFFNATKPPIRTEAHGQNGQRI